MRKPGLLVIAISLVISAVVPAVFSSKAGAASGTRPARNTGVSAGQKKAIAPKSQAIQLVDLAGVKKLLGGEKQAKPLLVNFWATWCDPCRDEFPDLVKVDQDYRRRGLDFITISLDDAADIKTLVPNFLRQMKATMPAYLLNVSDPEPVITTVDKDWGGALPATFLYDAKGKVVFKHYGRVSTPALREAIERVMSGK
jgi:thiol-disulfide isomerase/thioredoxin